MEDGSAKDMKKCVWLRSLSWGLAALLNLSVFAQEKAATTTQKAEKLPSAEEILKRYVEQVGGERAFSKYKSQHALGTIEMGAQQLKGKMEVFAARPNKLLVIMDIPGVGKITTGYNGEIGWMNNPLTGPMILPESMLEQVATQADFDHALRKPEDYKSMEVLGLEEFAGEPSYKLKLVHRSGFESTEFFSKETGLQKGFIAKQESPFGAVNVTTEITDYEKFGDIHVPSRIIQKVSGMEQIVTIDEMDFNDVPDSKFDLPPEVKTLTEATSANTSEQQKEPQEKKPVRTNNEK